MPNYTLHYFNSTGRAEIARLIFHYAGVQFTDHRFEFSEWPELKKDSRLYPFGQVPTLEVDGTVIAQSMAIARYLAEEFGLAGKNNLEKARANMIADGLQDLFPKFGSFMREKDEAKKEELKKKLLEEELPATFSVIEKLLSENNEGKGYLVGDSTLSGFELLPCASLLDCRPALSSKDKVTWADFLAFDMNDLLSKHSGSTTTLDAFPLLKGLSERVSQLPKIKAYLESRS